jgi:putative ABC transport system ATP-binding protein
VITPGDKQAASGSLIRLRDLTKTYDMGGAAQVYALRGVNLDIFSGEYVSIMGPSGSGKSTLMNMLGCLDTPTSGSYFLKGQDISKATDDELAVIRNQKIGFVFQTFNLLSRATAIANVELPLIYAGVPAEQRQERAAEALRSVGLGDRLGHHPNMLSGGERQRVAIARALITNPSVILADEPTGNLDSKSGQEIMRIFADIHEAGNTIIMVTHDLHISNYTKRRVELLDGAIVSDEPVEEQITSDQA